MDNNILQTGESKVELLSFTSEIVSAHVANNTLNTDELPSLIKTVFSTLVELNKTNLEAANRPQPAVPIKKSIFPDHIVCLEDGKRLKMLKRHLKAVYNMTPEQYRERWGLSADYPMVAPNYANRRSELAKQIGLGRKKKADRVLKQVA